MEESEEENARDGADDGIEEEVIGEDGYAEGVLLFCLLAFAFAERRGGGGGGWGWFPSFGDEEHGELSGKAGDPSKRKMGKHTRNDPRSPKTLKTFAKCRYHVKLLARWNGSSGSWEKSTLEMTFDANVARATSRVIVLGDGVSNFHLSILLLVCCNLIRARPQLQRDPRHRSRSWKRCSSKLIYPQLLLCMHPTYLDLATPILAGCLMRVRWRLFCFLLIALPGCPLVASPFSFESRSLSLISWKAMVNPIFVRAIRLPSFAHNRRPQNPESSGCSLGVGLRPARRVVAELTFAWRGREWETEGDGGMGYGRGEGKRGEDRDVGGSSR